MGPGDLRWHFSFIDKGFDQLSKERFPKKKAPIEGLLASMGADYTVSRCFVRN